MMTVKEQIKKIMERWFIIEPLLFAISCSHELVENKNISIPFRTGNHKIEFNSEILTRFSDEQIEEYLKIELFRILLKHPYQRQPSFPNRRVLTLASNITIADCYPVSVELSGVNKWPLPPNLCFEEYYAKVFAILVTPPQSQNRNDDEKSIIPPDKPDKDDEDDESESDRAQAIQSQKQNQVNGGGQLPTSNLEEMEKQLSELWEEDEEICDDINSIIEITQASNSWGTIGGKLQSLINASMKIEMDYRRMLSIFKTSVISNKRLLTRMRPSRRYGFKAMGSRYELATNLLIAVDVSGSVTDRSLSYFFSIINRFFKYGIEKLDVIQFDAELKSKKPIPLKKAKHEVKVIGRGGTSFQPAADYYCSHHEYDGLVYFTDGYAPPPVFNTKLPIDVLWVLCGKQEYEQSKVWIKSLKRNRATYIPKRD